MHTLQTRLLLLGGLLGAELLVATLLLDGEKGAPAAGLAAVIRAYGAAVARGGVVFAALFGSFAFLRHRSLLEQPIAAPVRFGFLLAHVVAAMVFAATSNDVYAGIASQRLAATWILAALAMPPLAAAAFAPLVDWTSFARRARSLWLHTAFGTALAMAGVTLFQSAWKPASRLTFTLVETILRPFYGSNLTANAESFRIATGRFGVIIAEECSGLEGIGLLIAFGVVCLALFREELRFPHCLALFPIGITILFLLNTVRIAALITIGHFGARDIAIGGFHSQAGWIAFNGVAFGLCLLARRWSWIWLRVDNAGERTEDEPTTAFLAPFLAILAAGMFVHAMSGAFEWLYSVRMAAAALVLWRYRKTYSTMNWRAGWPAIVAGLGVFVLWIGADWFQGIAIAPMPGALAEAGVIPRTLWITMRSLGAIVIVPVAEELAFRGFLLRRIGHDEFQAVSFERASRSGLALSSVLFGLLHGSRWPAGIAAGFAYAWAVRARGRIGDAVVAHAITNGLIAVLVIGLGQWQLW